MSDVQKDSIEVSLERAKAAYHSNDLARCESLCHRVVEKDPTCVTGLLLIGFCCGRTGRREEAVRLFESTLLLDPDLPEAHIGLSTLYVSAGRILEGKLHGLRVLELDPTDPTPALALAKQLAQRQAYEAAIEVWQMLIAKFPGNLNYLRSLALTQGLAKKRKDAISTWREVVRRSPRSVGDLLEFGKACLADALAEEAIETSKAIFKLDRKNPHAHMLAAMALSEKGHAKQAEGHLLKVLEVQPADPIALASLGLAMQEQGRFDEARTPLWRSLELWPSNGLAYYALVRSQRVTEANADILQAIQTQLATQTLDPLHAAYMHYALGKGREDLEEYEASFRAYEEANRVAYAYWLAHRPWDKQRYAFNFDRTIDVFTRSGIEAVQRSGGVSHRPLFVVGMIRSGTTLVEQILSSHPDICAAGEQTFWHEHAGRIFNPDTKSINEEQLQLVAEEYLELLNTFSTTSARVTDKLPHNYALMGIIKAAIPGAKFIHIKRNPLDNCLSIFTTAYQRPPAFTLDIENIVFAYRHYERLMGHWRAVLTPDDLLEIQYEDLVLNREEKTREMIRFTDLPWSDACLSHEKNARSVHTPSTWQVRQPIYSSSIERWRRFEPWLVGFNDLRA